MSFLLNVGRSDGDDVRLSDFLKLPGVKAGEVAHRGTPSGYKQSKDWDQYYEQFVSIAGHNHSYLLQGHGDDIMSVVVYGRGNPTDLDKLEKLFAKLGAEVTDDSEFDEDQDEEEQEVTTKQKTNYRDVLTRKAAEHTQIQNDRASDEKAPSFVDIKNRRNKLKWEGRKFAYDRGEKQKNYFETLTFKQYLISENEDWQEDIDDEGHGVGLCPRCKSPARYRGADEMKHLADAKARFECTNEECGHVGRWHHYGE